MQFNSPLLSIQKYIETMKKNRQKKLGTTLFEFGLQDSIDLISYSGLEEHATYFQIDDTYYRCVFVSGYPYIASSGWLNSLIHFNHNIDISYHVEHIDAQLALPRLTRKITEMESTKRAMIREGKIVGSELLDPLESAIDLKEKILRGQEKLFQVSIYALLQADTIAELNKITTLLDSTLATKLFFVRHAMFRQLDGLQSVLPRGQNMLGQRRNLDTSSTSLTFPFISSELVQESGILYGINKSNNSLVIVDRFSLHNANSIIFAQSGAGKSYAAKVEILRQIMLGTQVIVIDPEGEYIRLCESLSGSYIKLSVHSREKINPFELPREEDKDQLYSHIQDVTELLSLMLEGLNADEKAIIDKALLELYEKFGEKGKTPLLKDFYAIVKSYKKPQLLDRLEKFVKGSLSLVFDNHTNIDLENSLIVFDIKDLPESIRQIMLLVIAQFIQKKVKSNPVKRLLVIDEGWLLLQHEESARFIAGLTRRARKYYLGVNIITQQAQDFLNNEYGKAIASQSSMRLLLRQDTTTIRSVVDEFKLSEYEEHFLLTCDKGEALLIADQNHVAVKIVASDKEHPLITTNPSEIIAP